MDGKLVQVLSCSGLSWTQQILVKKNLFFCLNFIIFHLFCFGGFWRFKAAQINSSTYK